MNNFLTVADRLIEAHGLAKHPKFTTIEKFVLRVPSTLLERVLGGFVLLTRIRGQVFSPDSSGFSPNHVSRHYALRIKRHVLSSMKRQVRQKERCARS